MTEKDSKETRSFVDPMTPRLEAAKRRREAKEAEYPQAASAYDGFYIRLSELTTEGTRFILGAEGAIGSRLQYESATGFLLANDGRQLAQLPGKTAERLAKYSSANWCITPLVSTTYFKAQDKSAAVDIAFICWAPLDAPFDSITASAYDEALAIFSHNIAGRLASGDRAGLALTQDEFVSVLRSSGAWYLTKTTKRDPLDKGTIVYKARRSGIERISAYAVNHRVGCNILASVFWVLLLGGIGALLWFLFFS